MKLRQLTREDVTIKVKREDEDLDIKDMCYDLEAEKAILELAEKTEWGWCYVTVTVEWENEFGMAGLGGCSYESEKDFCKDEPGEYYHDMINEALEDLNKNILATILHGEDLRRMLEIKE